MSDEPLKAFEPFAGRPVAADEQNISALINSDHANEADLRALGRIAEADALKASRDGRVAEWRTAAGLATPTTPDPKVVAAADYGIRLDAKPSDYRRVDLSAFARERDPARVENVRVELAEVMSALKIDVPSGQMIMQHIAEQSPKLAAMTPAERETWAATQERDLVRSAAIRSTTVEALKANAKALLSSHPFGATIAASAMISSPTVLLILHDHAKAIQAWKGK
ncbi:hypothetical protein [Hyphomicrobium sp. ghe19]|uniref:hypothetical protein n=1 Tax=Hyphomicrobium sp. ghe19 TaxID=2682968 RepID=UPI00136721EB|nr:hypothetical protein HYPP_02380 [Hyphomicrobium sp. ghe19]